MQKYLQFVRDDSMFTMSVAGPEKYTKEELVNWEGTSRVLEIKTVCKL